MLISSPSLEQLLSLLIYHEGKYNFNNENLNQA